MSDTKDTKYVTDNGGEVILARTTLTHWCDPDSMVPGSSYGIINYRHWCEKEMTRINRRDNSVLILTRQEEGKRNGYIALYRQSDQPQ
jgi:hypothetical protein